MHEDALLNAKDIIAEYWSTIALNTNSEDIENIHSYSKRFKYNYLPKKVFEAPKIICSFLKIDSINIGGTLDSKIAYINKKFLKKHKYDILALLETHTFMSNMNWLKNTFSRYSVVCE